MMDQFNSNTTKLRFLPSSQHQPQHVSNIHSTPPSNYPYQHQQQRQLFFGGGVKRQRCYDEEEEEEQAQPPNQLGTFQIRYRSMDKTRGLRHFAHKVCEKVKLKGQTNYNEVADELVTEYFDHLAVVPSDPDKYQYDVRNIRRRVYDALNVLMAMNIIEKERKEIRWVGLPTSSLAECRRLEEERAQRQERIRQKTEQLQELIVQLVAYKSLVQRNRERERVHGRPPNSAILYLPYIVVSTERKTMVECAIAPDKSEYWFNFDRPFEIHDDIEVLKRLGLAYGIERGEVPAEHVPHIKACLPPALRDYVDQIVEGTLTHNEGIGGGKVGATIKNGDEHTAVFPYRENDKQQQNQHSSFSSSPSLLKLDSGIEPIVVRTTRANLSGVAPSGDGGPMGSFLAPMQQQIVRKNEQQQFLSSQTQQQMQPVARCTVIPRPVNTRLAVPHWQNARSQQLAPLQQPQQQQHLQLRPLHHLQQQQQSSSSSFAFPQQQQSLRQHRSLFATSQQQLPQRLGGVLHYDVPVHHQTRGQHSLHPQYPLPAQTHYAQLQLQRHSRQQQQNQFQNQQQRQILTRGSRIEECQILEHHESEEVGVVEVDVHDDEQQHVEMSVVSSSADCELAAAPDVVHEVVVRTENE